MIPKGDEVQQVRTDKRPAFSIGDTINYLHVEYDMFRVSSVTIRQGKVLCVAGGGILIERPRILLGKKIETIARWSVLGHVASWSQTNEQVLERIGAPTK